MAKKYYTIDTNKKGATLNKQETVLTAFRLPKTLKERVDKASDGNVSEFVRRAIEEKLDRVKGAIMKDIDIRFDTTLAYSDFVFKVQESYFLPWEKTRVYEKIRFIAASHELLVSIVNEHAEELATEFGAVVRWNFEGSPQGYYVMPKNWL